MFLLVTLIALVYFCLDLEKINSSVKALLPERVAKALSAFRSSTFSVLGKYVASYLIILLITFTVMITGLLIIGVKKAPLIALIIALFDILPIIGVGTVLLPWSIFEFASGSVARGVGLLLLFLVNTVVRQFSEPRIVGKSVDLHPILTLVLIYSGYALFGVVGIALVPVFSVIVGLLFKNKSTAKVEQSPLSQRDGT